jgi:hypothetical protein
MKMATFASLVSLLAITSAEARERAFRTPNSAAFQHQRVSTMCTFKALQTSGYRAAAGERKICYFDCEGAQTAITVPVDRYCSQDQAMLIHGRPATTPSSAARTRMKVELDRAAP